MSRSSLSLILLLAYGGTDVLSKVVAPPVRFGDGDIYYFGNGCMWRVQHLMATKFEQAAPQNRTGADVTATAGYAAGRTDGPTPQCYPNSKNVSNYELFGSAEAVRVSVRTPAELAAAGKAFFADFIPLPSRDHLLLGTHWVRPDYYDVGTAYRAVIGIPGGETNDAAMAVLRRKDVNIHNLALVAGKGGDSDNLRNNSVWIMDSRTFHFQPAELCMQFHDDQNTKYSPAYHALKDARVTAGTLGKTGCPQPYPCAPRATWRE